MKTIQQFSDFEYGVHLLVNAKSILNDLLIHNQEYFIEVQYISNILKPSINKKDILELYENQNDIQQICHKPQSELSQYKTIVSNTFTNTVTKKSRFVPNIDNLL